ncbi:MAG: hypothetical protein PVJ84_20615, partial [Desulfobacteraceae bacterium]
PNQTPTRLEEKMHPNTIKHTCLTMVFLLAACFYAQAGDLDDGIKIDEKIEKYDTLDRPGINIQYIKRSAKASAASGGITSTGSGDTAIGGFINKPGAEVGDVTIIFDGEDITTVSD